MDRYLNYKCVLILILIKCVYCSDKSDDLHTGPIPSCDSDDGNFEVTETTERLNKTTQNETITETTQNETITETTQNETVSDIATQTDPQQTPEPIVYYLVQPHPTIQQPTHSGYEPQPQQPQHPQPYTAQQYPGYQPIPVQQPIPPPQLEHYGTGYGPIPIQQPIPPPQPPVTIPIPHPYEQYYPEQQQLYQPPQGYQPQPTPQYGPYGPYQTQPPQGTGYYGTQQPIPIQQPYQPYQEPQIPIPIPYPQIHIPEQHIQPQPQIQQSYGPQHQQHPPIHQPYGPIPQPIPIPILQPIPRQQIPYQHPPPIPQPIPQIPQHQQIPIHTPPQSPHQGYPIPYQPIQPPPEQGYQHPIPIPRQPIPPIRLTTYGPPRFRPQVPIRLTTYGPPRFRPRGIPGPIIQRPTYMPTTESINYGPTQQTIPTEEPSQEDSKESTEPSQTMEPSETQDSSVPTTHEPTDEPRQAEEPTKEPSAETSTQANTQTQDTTVPAAGLQPETIPVEIESDEDEEPPKPPSGPGDGDQPPDKPGEGGEEGDGEEPEEEEEEDKKPPEIIRTCKTITFMKLNEEGKLAEMILEKDYREIWFSQFNTKYLMLCRLELLLCDGEIVYTQKSSRSDCRLVIYNRNAHTFIFTGDTGFILFKRINNRWNVDKARKFPEDVNIYTIDNDGNEIELGKDSYEIDITAFGSFKYRLNQGVRCTKIIYKNRLVWEKTDESDYPSSFCLTTRNNVMVFTGQYIAIYGKKGSKYRHLYTKLNKGYHES
uniref:Theileria-specific sub-telomeric protein, SVSP family, putative n=1 Tax=Theileria annulata TaxID=5874 RepID=A0A3B0MS82_THEAN